MLTLKNDISIAEVVGAATAISVGISAIYNWGYFVRIEASILSLMSLQDLMYGAVIGFVSLVSATLLGSFIGDLATGVVLRTNRIPFAHWFEPLGPSQKPTMKSMIGFFASMSAFVALGIWAANSTGSTTSVLFSVHFLAGYFGLTLATWAGLSREMTVMLFLVMVSAIAYTAGRSSFEQSVYLAESTSLDTLILADGPPVRGHVVRLTSEYALVMQNTSFLVTPLTNVRKFWRDTELPKAEEKI